MLLQALNMGLINTVVPLEKLEEETAVWCREILRNSPTALRVLKAALNAAVRRSPQAGMKRLQDTFMIAWELQPVRLCRFHSIRNLTCGTKQQHLLQVSCCPC